MLASVPNEAEDAEPALECDGIHDERGICRPGEGLVG
jgi:hypothetical protein